MTEHEVKDALDSYFKYLTEEIQKLREELLVIGAEIYLAQHDIGMV